MSSIDDDIDQLDNVVGGSGAGIHGEPLDGGANLIMDENLTDEQRAAKL